MGREFFSREPKIVQAKDVANRGDARASDGRTHLSLKNDGPAYRLIQLLEQGRVVDSSTSAAPTMKLSVAN